jgi:hypothetical protein
MACTPWLGWSILEILNVITLSENDRQMANL